MQVLCSDVFREDKEIDGIVIQVDERPRWTDNSGGVTEGAVIKQSMQCK